MLFAVNPRNVSRGKLDHLVGIDELESIKLCVKSTSFLSAIDLILYIQHRMLVIMWTTIID